MTKMYRLIIETYTGTDFNDPTTYYNRTEIDTLIEIDSKITARDFLKNII